VRPAAGEEGPESRDVESAARTAMIRNARLNILRPCSTAISNYEQGLRRPSIEAAQVLAGALVIVEASN
jgi:transcriptional regulator with XRE-family HTH domain